MKLRLYKLGERWVVEAGADFYTCRTFELALKVAWMLQRPDVKFLFASGVKTDRIPPPQM